MMVELNEQVSFEPLPEEALSDEPVVSFEPQPEVYNDKVPVDEKVVQDRAERAEIAAKGFDGRTDEGTQEAADQIRGGAEDILRKQLITKREMQLRRKKIQFIRERAIETNTPFSVEAVREFLQFSPEDLQNPDMITESLFAEEMLDSLASAAASKAEDPLAHSRMAETFGGILAKREWLQVKLEQLEKRLSDRGIAETVQNFLGQFLVPGRERTLLNKAQSDAGQRGPVDESLILSTSLDQQHTVLMLLRPDEFIRNVNATVEDIWDSNPNVAAEWVRRMLDRSTSSDFYTDLLDVVDVSGLVPIGGFGLVKGVIRGAGNKKALGLVVSQQAKAIGLTTKNVSKSGKGSPKPLTAAIPTGPAGQKFLASVIDMLSTLGRRKIDIPDVEAVRGAPTRAAAKAAVEDLQNGLFDRLVAVNSVESVKRLLKDLPTIMTPGKIISGSSRLAGEQKRRLTAWLDKNSELALRAATRTRTVSGRPKIAIDAGLEETLKNWAPHYKSAANDVLDTVDITPVGAPVNVLTAGIKIGHNGKPFTGVGRDTQAANHAAHLGLDPKTYKIVDDGENTTIMVMLTIDETTPLFRAQVVRASPTPISYRNMAGALLFGTDDQVSAAFRQNAKVAVLSQNNYSAFANEMFKPIRSGMSRSQKNDLEHYLESQRAHERFNGLGEFTGVGRFDDTVGEFERNFEKIMKRWPEPVEILGYFTFRQLNDLDLLTNNFGVFRDKARAGVQRHILTRLNKAGLEEEGSPVFTNTGGIEGKIIKPEDFDYTDLDSRMLLHDPVSPSDSTTQLLTGRDFPEGELKGNFKSLVEKAAQDKNMVIIQLNNDGQRVAAKEFKEFLGGDLPDFIMTTRVKSGQIELSQIPNSPGGHNIYPDGSFLKQGNIIETSRGLRYAGDRAIVNLPYHPDAVKLAGTMEEIRKLIKLKDNVAVAIDETALKAAIARTPFGETQIRAWFTPKIDDNGQVVEAAFLRLDQKIHATRSSERTTKLDKYAERGIRVKENVLDRGVSADFATHRDKPLETIVGSEDSPAFDIRHNQFITPFATLQKSLDTIADNRFMDDFKFRAQDAFFTEFGDMLDDVGDLSGIQHAMLDPLDAALNGKLKKEGFSAVRRQAAKAQQRILRNILGQETNLQQTVRHAFQGAMDSLYSRFGEKAVMLVPDSTLALLQDPAKYIRNIAFHSKLGLFNPVQLFLQAQGAVNMVGIAGPKVAWNAAGAAGQFMRLGFTNHDGTIRKFAEMQSKMGKGLSWTVDEFEEAYHALSNSGFMRVGGEVAQRNTQRAASLDRSLAGRALDKTTILFDIGERFNRTIGYTAAYRRWRTANPKASFDEAAQDIVLDMADTLSGNMTRVSNAAWQKGILSIPTQFFAYQARIAELMLPTIFGGSKRITGLEKARMFGIYSLMYGVPVAAGAATAVYPWYDKVREELLLRGLANPDTGSEVTDNIIYALHQGIVSTSLRMAGFGEVNFAERYGPGGLDVFRDWMDGEKPLFEVLSGVSGSVIGDIFRTAEPLLMDIVSAFSGDPVDAPMLALDLMDLANNVSSMSALTRFYMGATTARYYTRNATLLNDQEQGFWEAAATAMTGLTLLDTADDFLRVKLGRIRKRAQREGMKESGAVLRKAFLPNTSESLRSALLKRAGNIAMLTDLDRRQIQQVVKQNLKGIPLSETTGAQFSLAFGKGNPELIKKLAKDSQRGRQ